MVAHFSRSSISGATTFHPNLWGNGREPADMLITVGRALVFVNMTEGKSYLDSLCAHNLDQARDRINEWRNGPSIKGETSTRKFDIGWDDIDYVQVVSVVDGPHAACRGHDLSLLNLDPKVRLATTVTSAIIRHLAALGGGARDLIAICQMIGAKGEVSECDALKMTQSHHDSLRDKTLLALPRMPNRLPKAIIGGRKADPFEEHRFYLESMRKTNDDVGVIFADLSWTEIFDAVGFILTTLADAEWVEQGVVSFKVFDAVVPFIVVVSTSNEGLVHMLKPITETARAKGARFTYILSLQDFHTIPTLAIEKCDGPWATAITLSNIGD